LLREGGVKVREGMKPPLSNLFPLSKSGEGDTGGEVPILKEGSLKNQGFFRVKRG
jgi:hypothetical protein